MPRVILPIANGAYVSRSLPLSAQQCINWYPVVDQNPVLNPEYLLGTPGFYQLTTSGGTIDDANRGAHVMAGAAYFVNGNKLYRLESDTSTLTDLGTITGTGPVWMVDNGTQLCILVPGVTSTGYIFTTGPDTLTTITDLDFTASGQPQTVVYIDGYFLFTTDSKKFIVSELNDGLNYNALDFGSAEADPDDITAAIVFRNQLFIAGSNTIEAFQNVGGADFPFQRTGLVIEKGVYAPHSLISANDTFMFVGGAEREQPAVWALNGNSVTKVSTEAIDSELQRFTAAEIANTSAWSYAAEGHYFVGFSLPATTFVYDTTSGRWHERRSQIQNAIGQGVSVQYRVASIVQAYGCLIVGDRRDGRIGKLDYDSYKEYENNIVRTVSTQPFQNDMNTMFVSSIELTVESGVGNSDAPDPVIVMDMSLDGGKTFKFSRERRLGKQGEYKHRTIWRRNGRVPRFVVLRFVLSDPVKPVILQLTANIKGPDNA